MDLIERYYEELLKKYMPEIELIKKDKIRAKRDDEIDEFIKKCRKRATHLK